MIIQFCGLSGSGKTTLANRVKKLLDKKNLNVEILDGDDYRKGLCADLGFSKEDRNSNIRRLAFVASKLSKHKIIAIICAINPYEEIRQEITLQYPNVKMVLIDCNLDELIKRDTKGLYHRALLPDWHANKINNLTGINDPFERPQSAEVDLLIRTDIESIQESTDKLTKFILDLIKSDFINDW
jgi:adenylylsulfate kinase